MKIDKIIYSLFLVMGLGAVSCNDDLAEPPIPEPDGGEVGIGTWDSPMTAAQALTGYANDSIAQPWVVGYIAGYVDTNVSTSISAASGIVDAEAIRGGKCDVNTNMLITSKNPDAEGVVITWEDCATVQLPSGAVRNALNLKDHPDNYGKLVCLRGTTGSRYCGAYGVRSVSDYNWGDKGKESKADEVQPVSDLFQGFDKSTDLNYYKALGWRVLTVSGNVLGWGIATEGPQNYIVASAYSATSYGGPYEDWLVSPAVNLDQSPEKSLSFRMRSGYRADGSTMEVWLMQKDEPVRRLEANIPEAPADGYGDWVRTSIDLSGLSGDIRIAWRYRSEHGGRDCTAYCLDDVNIGGAPEVVYTALDGAATSITWTFDNINLGGMANIWSWTQRNGGYYLYGTAWDGSSSHESLAYAVSPLVSLGDRDDLKAEFEHAASYQRNIKQLCGFMIRLEGQSEWTQLEIPVWPKPGNWDFANSGRIDISAYRGKTVQFAFKYASTASNADSWEIRNFQVTGKSSK